MAENYAESQRSKQPPHWRLVFDQAMVTPEVLSYQYVGEGTEENPYVVEWIPNDPRNPMGFPRWKKWAITMVVAIATLAVAFVSSAYTGGIRQVIMQFEASQEVVTLGVSLFVLGFAVGPLLWAPLSEIYGRQVLFLITYGALAAFNAGAAGSQNIHTLIILRFFAGAFGSSPLTNAGGAIADMFPARERGLAMSLFAAAPFLGPVIGPIVGGFLGETEGWRWVEGLMAIFAGSLWIFGGLVIPETYAPVLLQKRAAKLSKMTGKVYVSKLEAKTGKVPIGELFKTALSRPWILLFTEPIVLIMSIYMAIIYGTLYMLFAAFPIVFEEGRGWSAGISGLAFVGVAVGMISAIIYTIPDNKRYIKVMEKHDGIAPPEARLPPAIIGSIGIPVGLFWFAWTNYPSIHWLAPIAAGAPFGFGMVLVFLSIMNYLIDSYTIFAASVLAANSVLRSLFGAAFPLFTTYMYDSLGIHWASSVPAFLALACTPFPLLFYIYGAKIRQYCKFAAESAAFMSRLQRTAAAEDTASEAEKAMDPEKEAEYEREQHMIQIREEEEEAEEGVGNPYDIDRVNSREAFSRVRSNHSRSGRTTPASRRMSASSGPSRSVNRPWSWPGRGTL